MAPRRRGGWAKPAKKKAASWKSFSRRAISQGLKDILADEDKENIKPMNRNTTTKTTKFVATKNKRCVVPLQHAIVVATTKPASASQKQSFRSFLDSWDKRHGKEWKVVNRVSEPTGLSRLVCCYSTTTENNHLVGAIMHHRHSAKPSRALMEIDASTQMIVRRWTDWQADPNKPVQASATNDSRIFSDIIRKLDDSAAIDNLVEESGTWFK